jgi:predicted amino acid racemase
MTAPRLEIDLRKLHHNARTLVERLSVRGIAVTGITKATMGSPAVAGAMLRAGVRSLGDSRVENLEALRRAGVTAPLMLVRSPMLSQVDRVVAHADVSCNSEPDVLTALAAAAAATGRTHRVVLMVELGDLREGILPGDLAGVVRAVQRLPALVLAGIGTNLACQSGVAPDAANMGELSALVLSIEDRFGLTIGTVSGGNSGNLDWALGDAVVPGRVNDLRLGESILLGCEPLHRRPIEGLHTDAITLVAEVIESKRKPSRPRGELGQTAFGTPAPAPAAAAGDRDGRVRTIVAVGHQDVDPAGLRAPAGIEVLGASSDHLILDAGRDRLPIGAEVAFRLDYSALVRAMTSRFVEQVVTVTDDGAPVPGGLGDGCPFTGSPGAAPRGGGRR